MDYGKNMKKDYKTIISEINEAVKEIEDTNLKEIAFKDLLNDALDRRESNSVSGTESVQPPQGNQPKKSNSKRSVTEPPFRLSSVRQELRDAMEDFDPNMVGIKPLNSLKQKWEQYIWVLEIARQKGFDSLTNSEIAYVLSEKFSLGATEKQVNNLTFKAKDGIVFKREVNGVRAWKILQPGIKLIEIGSESVQ